MVRKVKTPEQRAAKAAYDKVRYAAKREVIRARAAEYRKRTQPEIKARRRAYYAAHKADIRAKADAWAAANPEKARASARKRATRRRYRLPDENARKQLNWRAGVAGFTHEDVANLRLCNDGVCAYCLKAGLKLEVDHVDPLSRQGAHDIGNCVMACRSCNARKNAKTPLEFMLKWL